eukprot:g285.t1
MLNREMPQFTAAVQAQGAELKLHFVHRRSSNPNAKPLLITHGWPGSFIEFHKIIGPLTEPQNFGGRADQAFHVVCPSMPGYGFSEAPKRRGFNSDEVARAENQLMVDVLGYTTYFAQGGDWGVAVTRALGVLFPQNCVAIHVNGTFGGRPPEMKNKDPSDYSESEQAMMARSAEFGVYETGYQQIQGTKPQTLGYGITDSPTGLAGWLLEKYTTWSDPATRLTTDDQLMNLMVYWLSGCATSSFRLYYESFASMPGTSRPQTFTHKMPDNRVTVPTAAAVFPKELGAVPRSWMATACNLVRFTEFEKGGHFAALEAPESLASDIRAFFHEDV